MTLRFFLLLCLAARWACTPAQVLDDFSDGDLSQAPPWFGDTADFEVISGRLHLNAPAQTDTSWISTPISPPDPATWEMDLQLDFNPSSSNYLRWYLLADDAHLSAAQEGYYVQVGGSANDRISLKHFLGGTETAVWESANDLVDLDTVSLQLRVSHLQGMWTLERSVNGSWMSLGSGSHTLSRPFQHTGLWCRYTSTRSDRFSFDELGYQYTSWIDTVDPAVTQHQLPQPSLLRLFFSETVVADSVRLRKWTGGSWFNAHPDIETGLVFDLTLDEPILEDHLYQVELTGWSDLSGRTLDTAWTIRYYRPRLRDLLITEIMSDPNPPVELPNKEYIELYNRSGREIDLDGLALWVNDAVAHLAAGKMAPDSLAVLTDLPALPNAGAELMLKDTTGRLIDAVRYSVEDHTAKEKKEGGWSLTLVDTSGSCYGGASWASSRDPRGGSPGSWGYLEKIRQPGNRWLHYGLEEGVYELRWLHPLDSAYWAANPPEMIGGGPAVRHALVHPLDREVWEFDGAVPPEGLRFHWPGGLRDCRGHYFVPDTLLLMPVERADSGHWRVTEILFEPGGDRPEWIEWLNAGDKALDLSELRWGTYNRKFEVINHVRQPFDGSLVVVPGERIVWCRDPEFLWGFYSDLDSFKVYRTNEWLTLTNDTLFMVLTNSGFEILEPFGYSMNMHVPYLKDTRDISLERRHPGLPADLASSWHSGPEALGGATPTRPNSFSGPEKRTSGTVQPELFTPNGDGFNDYVRLNWFFPEPGWRARVFITDMSGQVVFEHPVEGSVPAGFEWIWSGQSYSGARCAPGIYFWVLELRSPADYPEIHRIPCILSF